MDFSEKRLVSFGDSYTFGQGCTVDADMKIYMKPGIKETDRQIRYANACHKGSYTNFLFNRLRFKSQLNFGIPGSSNAQTLHTLYNYISNNDTSDDFFIINYTASFRKSMYVKNPRLPVNEHHYLTLRWDDLISESNGPYRNRYFKDVSTRTFEEIVLYLNNDLNDLYEFIVIYNNIVTLLETKNIPYVMFDILGEHHDYSYERFINDIDTTYQGSNTFNYLYGDKINYNANYAIEEWFSKTRYNKLYKNMHTERKVYINGNNLPLFGFDLTNIEDTYTISKDKDLRLYKTMNIGLNMHRYISHYANIKNLDLISPLPGDGHWNMDGNKLAAKIIEYWILENYG